MHYDFTINGEIKRTIKKYGVRYEDIARIIKYSEQTIKMWLLKPLSDEHEKLIRKGLDEIIVERKATREKELIATEQMKHILSQEHITYNAVAKSCYLDASTISKWLNSPLTSEREAVLKDGIARIMGDKNNKNLWKRKDDCDEKQ